VASELSHLAEEIVGLVGGTREPWFPTLRQALDGIDHMRAAQRPSNGLNSIWAVVNHISIWHELTLRQLRAEHLAQEEIDDSGWSLPAAGGPADWTRTQQELVARNANFAEAVGALSPAAFEERWAPQGAPRWQLVYGLMNHTSHHTADILIARRLLGIPRADR